ncbi:MAG TPA: lysophospholipid acyltransferase family protein [Steroidobacteraceae bacterium]|nr:lysophospholipid acyltransferase family protein [Steroidobacteraceae bacterium]
MTDIRPAGDALRNTIYKRYTGRRMGRLRRALYRVAAPLVLGLARLWWHSCRIVAIVGEEHLDQVLARWPSFLPCYWHQHTLFCAQYLLREQRRRPLRVGFLISPSVDGELGAMVLGRAGAHVIRGSSSRTGALALKEYYQALTRDAVSPVVSPDGPRGPRFQFKPGAVLLAQMSGRPIVPMAYAASRAWFVHWDRFVLPMPFARIAIAIGAPHTVPRVLDAARLERLQLEMAGVLRATFESARLALG